MSPRPRIHPLGYGRFWKIRKMKCFPEARAKLVAGVSTLKVARWIQEECGERTDVKEVSLAAELSAFRRSLSAMELVQTRQPGVFDDAVEKIDDGLNELAELAEIYAVQKKRILDMHALEQKLKVPNRTTGNEVRIAAELLRTSHQIKVDLGAANVDAGKAEPSVADVYNLKSRYGSGVAAVVGDAEKRTRVLSALSQLMKKAERVDEDKASGE